MRHWTQLGTAPIPGSEQSLTLFKSKDDFHIKLGNNELMCTRKHGSEDALGKLPCKRLDSTANARVLIGGLGMGFTLSAVLQSVGAAARVTVAELIPEVVEWNRGPLGEFSGYPVNDPRCDVQVIAACQQTKRCNVTCYLCGSHANFSERYLCHDNLLQIRVMIQVLSFAVGAGADGQRSGCSILFGSVIMWIPKCGIAMYKPAQGKRIVSFF